MHEKDRRQKYLPSKSQSAGETFRLVFFCEQTKIQLKAILGSTAPCHGYQHARMTHYSCRSTRARSMESSNAPARWGARPDGASDLPNPASRSCTASRITASGVVRARS